MTLRDPFTFRADVLPASTRVAGFRGSEGISTFYSFEVHLVMSNDVGGDLDMSSAVGTNATLTFEREDGRPPLRFNGMLSALELVHILGELSLFRAVLVPQLWRLTLSRHSRVFTDKALPEILRATLSAGGLSGEGYELRLLGSYAPQEHVCQYKESDYDFISRWMEREGLYYYFEQGEGAERTRR